MRRPSPAALALLALALSAGGAWAAPKLASIVVDNLMYGPAPAHLRVGDRLVWVNKDLFRHSATADDKSFDVDLQPGKQGEIVLKRPGTYSYFCKYHPGMKGRIVVGK